MQIINMTPHALNMITDAGEVIIPPSGIIARVSVTREQIGTVEVDGAIIPVNRSVFGSVEGLPEPQPDTYYVVSMLVAQAVPYRNDLLIVDDTVRDEQGRIIGARAFARV